MEGVLNGAILDTPRGTNGFGYAPVFEVPEYGKTLSEMTDEEKHVLSRRARALEKLDAVIDC